MTNANQGNEMKFAMKNSAGRLGARPVPLGLLPLAALVAIAAAPNAAQAGDTHYQYSYFDDVLNYGPGTYSGPGYSVILSTAPSLQLNTTWSAANVSNGGEQQWRATVVYEVTVNGPASPVPVPLDVTYSIVATSTVIDNAYALAQARFSYDENPNFNYTPVDVTAGGFTDGYTTSGGTIKFSEYAGTTFDAGFSAVDTLYYPGSAAAVTIDPHYSIDPSFALTDPNYLKDYSLTFTPNVQNIGPAASVPVPEVGSLPLLATGLVGLLGPACFRRAPHSRTCTTG
jgi:hypothetical protein